MKRIGWILCAVLLMGAKSLWATAAQARIHIVATGGTIAGVGKSSTGSGYTAGQVSVGSLLDAVPGLDAVARLSSEQLFNVPSQDFTDDHWLRLAQRVNQLVESDSVDGVVITHGTDVMEETAYFLQLTTGGLKPIVLVGAMRPGTSLSADGPMNLFQAVRVAADPEARGRGVMVVMNGQIFAPGDLAKTHTVRVDAFQPVNGGALGEVHGEEVHFREPIVLDARSNRPPFRRLDGIDRLPRVGILYGHVSPSVELVDALIGAGYRGIVYAGVGNGNIHREMLPVLAAAVSQRGVMVVRASRVESGPVLLHGEVDDEQYGFVAAGEHSPQKARILLMLCLLDTDDRVLIQNAFLEY